MKVTKAVKIKLGGYFAMWFAGQLNNLQVLASVTRELADFMAKEAGELEEAKAVNEAGKNLLM